MRTPLANCRIRTLFMFRSSAGRASRRPARAETPLWPAVAYPAPDSAPIPPASPIPWPGAPGPPRLTDELAEASDEPRRRALPTFNSNSRFSTSDTANFGYPSSSRSINPAVQKADRVCDSIGHVPFWLPVRASRSIRRRDSRRDYAYSPTLYWPLLVLRRNPLLVDPLVGS